MRTTVYLALVPLLGCNTHDDGQVGPLFTEYSYADLYTDGSRLDVVGCPSAALIGCNRYAPEAAAGMQLVIDGSTVDVPVAPEDLPPIIDSMAGLFHDGLFSMSTTPPADGHVVVALGGDIATVVLPTPPPLYVPAHVSRSSGPVTIHHAVLAGQSWILVIVNTNCTVGGGGEFGDVETVVGEDALDLTKFVPATATTCTHEVHVDQILELANVPDVVTRAIAISTATITSDP